MGAEQVTTILSNNFLNTVSTILVDNIPIIIGILASLMGLGILIGYVKTWITDKKYYKGITGQMLHDEDYSNFRNRTKDNEM